MYIKHTLKNGLTLDFDDDKHIYYHDGKKVESVTGICGNGIPKPELVGWLIATPVRETKKQKNKKTKKQKNKKTKNKQQTKTTKHTIEFSNNKPAAPGPRERPATFVARSSCGQ